MSARAAVVSEIVGKARAKRVLQESPLRGYFGTRVLGFAARSGATAARSVGKVRRP